MSAWVLPDQFADVLPAEARHIEEMRRTLLDTARSYGYELVMPPLMEHLESLLSGTGQAQGLNTFKAVDQLSGRSIGVRADMTPQVARIDAHLLNREGVVRLCYCGPVAKTRAAHAHATREPLQFGAELFGHTGLEADIEILEMVRAALGAVGVQQITIDLADARIVKALVEWSGLIGDQAAALRGAISVKDSAAIDALTATASLEVRQALRALLELFGGRSVLQDAALRLPALPDIQAALSDLSVLMESLGDADVTIDLADVRGQGYYTGIRFAILAQEHASHMAVELARGGRYDEVGAVFGRHRPAVGFSMDLKELVFALPEQSAAAVIRAPWSSDASLRQVITDLRARGEVVIGVLPGHEHQVHEFECDRELVQIDGAWVVRPLSQH